MSDVKLPQELQAASRVLAQYGRWAQDRYKKQHCASIEHRYQSPDLEPRPEPFVPDFHAMDVQRTLNLVPLQYRRVLHAQYIPQRLPPHAIRRQLRLTAKTWDCSHLIGLRMFDNNWRLHLQQKVP